MNTREILGALGSASLKGVAAGLITGCSLTGAVSLTVDGVKMTGDIPVNEANENYRIFQDAVVFAGGFIGGFAWGFAYSLSKFNSEKKADVQRPAINDEKNDSGYRMV